MLRVSYDSKLFLEVVSAFLKKELNIPTRTVHGYKNKGGAYIKFTGGTQVGAIFEYLYDGMSTEPYRLEKYIRFCEVLNHPPEYVNIDLSMDVDVLWSLHEVCCRNKIDPNLLITERLKSFIRFCKRKGMIALDANKLIEQRQKVAVRLGYNPQNPEADDFFRGVLDGA